MIEPKRGIAVMLITKPVLNRTILAGMDVKVPLIMKDSMEQKSITKSIIFLDDFYEPHLALPFATSIVWVVISGDSISDMVEI